MRSTNESDVSNFLQFLKEYLVANNCKQEMMDFSSNQPFFSLNNSVSRNSEVLIQRATSADGTGHIAGIIDIQINVQEKQLRMAIFSVIAIRCMHVPNSCPELDIMLDSKCLSALLTATPNSEFKFNGDSVVYSILEQAIEAWRDELAQQPKGMKLGLFSSTKKPPEGSPPCNEEEKTMQPDVTF